MHLLHINRFKLSWCLLYAYLETQFSTFQINSVCPILTIPESVTAKLSLFFFFNLKSLYPFQKSVSHNPLCTGQFFEVGKAEYIVNFRALKRIGSYVNFAIWLILSLIHILYLRLRLIQWNHINFCFSLQFSAGSSERPFFVVLMF